MKTLKDVRIERDAGPVGLIHERMQVILPDLRSRKISGERQLARYELRPLNEADPIIRAAYLQACGTTLEEEEPGLVEGAKRELALLAGSISYAAWDSNPEPTDFVSVAA